MSAAATKVPTVKLNSGYELPVVGFGTWRAEKNQTKDSVYTALKAGYRHIDAARIYGNEKEVGEGIKRALDEKILTRDELFVTTKVWNNSHSQELALKSIRASLADLQLDYLDLVLIHWPVDFEFVEGESFPKNEAGHIKQADPAVANIKLAWQGLEAAVEQKLVRSIGVSNFTVAEVDALREYARIVPACNQIELHPYLQQEELLAYGRKHNIVTVAYSPLGNLKRDKEEEGKTPLVDETVKALAKKYGKSEGQIILKWGLQHGQVVLPKSVTPSRIESNLALFDFELSAEDLEQMKKLGAKQVRFVNPDFKKDGAKVWAQ